MTSFSPGAAALRAQQLAFASALLLDRGDTGSAPDAQAGPDGAAAAGLAGLLAAGPGGPARFDVYRHAYSARLVAALRDNFEALARALGDEAFTTLGCAYLAAHPSRQASIRWFGHRLAEFMDACLLADSPPDEANQAAAKPLVPHPALADLARMDWALRGAFDAADGPVIDRVTLAALPGEAWPGLVLRLHPSLQTVALHWAVEPAWHALHNTADGDEPELPAPEPLAHTLAVWRRGLETQWRSLSAAETALLQAAAAGQPFGALCERAAELVDDADHAVPLVAGTLEQWLADGLISTFET